MCPLLSEAGSQVPCPVLGSDCSRGAFRPEPPGAKSICPSASVGAEPRTKWE
ncbi:hypothetical protein CGRA01v4_00762 [Colletotrichum graminicola]|nr:hypothetical protein CGRA01v4_00762 [Colletotrichum graminicola]